MAPLPRLPVEAGRKGSIKAGDERDAVRLSAFGRTGERSSFNRSTDAELDDIQSGPGIACGRGEGGAGHRPGRAAAFSIRLRVCKCEAALLARDEEESATLREVDADGFEEDDKVGGMCDALEIGRGGEGVRRD